MPLEDRTVIALRIIAILLIAASAWALAYGGFSYTKERNDLKFGPIELAVREKETVEIPKWASVLGLAIGTGLLLAGGRKR